MRPASILSPSSRSGKPVDNLKMQTTRLQTISWFRNIHSHPLACRLFWLRKNPGARPFLSCCGLSPWLEKLLEASQEGWARVYLQLQDCDVRHLDVEREFRVPARVESVVFDRLRRWLRVPLEVLVVTSQDHLGNYDFRLL